MMYHNQILIHQQNYDYRKLHSHTWSLQSHTCLLSILGEIVACKRNQFNTTDNCVVLYRIEYSSFCERDLFNLLFVIIVKFILLQLNFNDTFRSKGLRASLVKGFGQGEQGKNRTKF